MDRGLVEVHVHGTGAFTWVCSVDRSIYRTCASCKCYSHEKNWLSAALAHREPSERKKKKGSSVKIELASLRSGSRRATNCTVENNDVHPPPGPLFPHKSQKNVDRHAEALLPPPIASRHAPAVDPERHATRLPPPPIPSRDGLSGHPLSCINNSCWSTVSPCGIERN